MSLSNKFNKRRYEKNLILFFSAILSSCDYSAQSSDVKALSHLINSAIANTEICIKDEAFRFPDVIVGTKYSGKSLAQLDALVSAGLLYETEEILSKPKFEPRYIYRYKQHHQIERKTFYLTEKGSKYYRTGQEAGFFCYGRPNNIQIEEIDSAKNDQGNLILTTTFSYIVKINPDAAWVSNTWIRREFPQASWGINRQTAQQQFIKDNKGEIKATSPGVLDERYW